MIKKLGVGSYGCVVIPNIACKNDEISETKVSKIFFSEQDGVKEKEIFEFVNTHIDPNNKFTIKMYNSCKACVPSQICNGLNHSKRYYIITMDYGGKSLSSFMSSKRSQFKFEDLMFHAIPLFDGLDNLINKKTVHSDIKYDNLLYDDKQKKINLIDFGSALYYKSFKNKFFTQKGIETLKDVWFFQGSLQLPLWFPPEIAYKIAQNDNLDINALLNMFNNQYKIAYSGFSLFDFIVQERKQRHSYIMQVFNNFKIHNSLEQVFQKYDIFSLGIELIQLYHQALTNNNVRNIGWTKKNLLPILRGCCDFNINARLTPQQAKMYLLNVFQKHKDS